MQGKTTLDAPLGASRIDLFDTLNVCENLLEAVWMMAGDLDESRQSCAIRAVCDALQEKFKELCAPIFAADAADLERAIIDLKGGAA